MSISIRKIIAEEIDKVIREERTEYDDGTVEVDNFEYAYESMQFKKPGDTLYYVQIVKRDKDNPGQKSRYNACQYLKSYYIKSVNELKSAESEIKQICQRENARAYIQLNPRSEYYVNKFAGINQRAYNRNPALMAKYGSNAKAVAAGKPVDDPRRPICFVDVDSDNFEDIKNVMKIIQDAGIKPLYAYRSLNNGIHIVLPNKDAAKKLDFTSINGNLSHYGARVKMNAKVGVEIDRPILLYARLSPQGYGKQQRAFNRWTKRP